MTMSDSSEDRFGPGRLPAGLLVLLLAAIFSPAADAVGPVFFDGDEAVSVYRDFDDGLFGRSLYRGVVFSVKLESFGRYRSLPVRDMDGLTAYLLSGETAERIARGAVADVELPDSTAGDTDDGYSEPDQGMYRFSRDGMEIEFSLERASEDLLEEVDRTYPGNPGVAATVKESYRRSWIIRIHLAENVYRPGVARIDYEDILLSASLLGDEFQPLWGIHDGNALLEQP